MAVRRIIRLGHPGLRRIADAVDRDALGSDRMKRLVDDMVDTLHDYGGIGLAATQINEPVRVAIVELPAGATRYGETESVPLRVLVNPRIEVVDPATAGYWEGCLSVPDLRGFVERPQNIRVHAIDLSGEPVTLAVEGFPATVFQHELDHLDGIVYVDRVAPGKLVFEAEFERYLAPTLEPRRQSAE